MRTSFVALHAHAHARVRFCLFVSYVFQMRIHHCYMFFDTRNIFLYLHHIEIEEQD